MKSSKIVCLFAGLILVTMIFSSCGGGSNPGKNKIAPTPTSAGTTPAPTIAGTTPTPTSIGVTPTPTSLGVTPTPTSAGATHTPTLTPTPIPTVAPTPTPYQFNCNFDSFPLGAWTLPANWSSNTSSAWAIVNPDSSNNKVQHTINGQTFLTCPYNNTIGGNNYTITAKVRVPTALQSNAGILVRYDSSAHNGYALVVTNSVGVSASVLEIKKITNWSDVQMNAVTITGSYLNITTYYTLTLTVSGTNPVQIDGSVTDGVNTKTVSWTDSSSPYTSGKVGLYAYGNAFPIFDDLSVTAQ